MSAVIDRTFADYRRLAGDLPGAGNAAVAAMRQRALVRFSEQGLPTPRDEVWRYTNLAALRGRDFSPAVAGGAEGLDIAPFLLDAELPLLVFVDGRYAPALSRPEGLGAGVSLATFGDLLRDAPDEAAEVLAASGTAEENAFADLNTAFATDGLVVRLARDAAPGRPLHLLHVVTGTGDATAAYLRNVVFAAAGSRATVIEQYVSAGAAPTVVSAVTRCVLEEGAALEHCVLDEQGDDGYHFMVLSAHQARDSRFTSDNVIAGSRISRVDLRVELAGPGAECAFNGLYLGRGRQGIDNYTVVDHQAPHCSSNELYKGVLDGRSRGAFTGHVIVRQDAQKTNAQQMSRSLLLSEQAEADARPQLVIDADDVKCSHGATVGQLDNDALFYLRARGIGEEEARAMLVRAFADEVIDRLGPESLRRRVATLVTARLAGGGA